MLYIGAVTTPRPTGLLACADQAKTGFEQSKIMADIKFTCPHCQQQIQCDQLWCGHQINCPTCQGAMVVPQIEAAPPAGSNQAPASTPGSQFVAPVLKPPPGGASRLSAGRTQVARSTTPAGIAQRPFQPKVQKKANPVLKWALICTGLAALGVGGYYGYDYYTNQAQPKFNAKVDQASKRPVVGGDVGQAMDVNDALENTQPDRPAPAKRNALKRKLTGADAGQGVPVAGDSGAAAADTGGIEGASTATGTASPAKQLPIVAPAYTLNVEQAKIPAGKVNGLIAGTNFVCETARLDKTPDYYALTLRQGTGLSPDRGVRVFLHLKPNEWPTNQTFTVSTETRDPVITQVVKLWKTNPRFAATEQRFSSGYALKLELGQATDTGMSPTGVPGTSVSGKIFLALPDTDKTVVGGQFTASLIVAAATPQLAPANPMRMGAGAGAGANPGAASRMRYGKQPR